MVHKFDHFFTIEAGEDFTTLYWYYGKCSDVFRGSVFIAGTYHAPKDYELIYDYALTVVGFLDYMFPIKGKDNELYSCRITHIKNNSAFVVDDADGKRTVLVFENKLLKLTDVLNPFYKGAYDGDIAICRLMSDIVFAT